MANAIQKHGSLLNNEKHSTNNARQTKKIRLQREK